MDNTAYYYNGSNGTYASWNGSTGSNGGSQYIAPGQGFFIHASDNGTFGVTNAARVSFQQSFWKSSDISTLKLLRLEASNDAYKNDIAIVFMNEATEDFDTEFDAYKLLSTNKEVPDIYSLLIDDEKLSINALNSDELNFTSNNFYAIPLGFTPGRSGVITLKATEISNIPESVFIYLHDKKEDIYTDLRSENYDFFTPSSTDDRFEILLSSVLLSNIETQNPNILIYTYKNTTFIKSSVFEFNKGNVYVFDVLGKLIVSKSTTTSNTQEVKIDKPGGYIIKIIVNNSVITQKVVVD